MLKKLLIGLLAGLVCGFFSSGGGLVLVPAFVYLFNLDEDRARATAIYAILPMVFISGFYYFNSSFIDWSIRIKSCYRWHYRRVRWIKIIKKISCKNLANFFYFFSYIYWI